MTLRLCVFMSHIPIKSQVFGTGFIVLPSPRLTETFIHLASHHIISKLYCRVSGARLLLLLLLSRFSRVRICATPETAAHEAPPSLGFSRQEHWIGLPFPSPTHESESEVTQSCPTPSDPMDCSLPGSSVHGIFQARVLERVAFVNSQSTSF